MKIKYNYRRWLENNISFEKITTVWQSKDVEEERRGLFDVAIGVYDGVGVCKLVGTSLLRKNQWNL